MNIYSEIRSSLQTFDILNCIPHNWFWGAIGHTAMVYLCKETGQVMVYESTQTARADGKEGVQLRPMKEWVDNYPGTIKCRHFEFDDLRRRLSSERSCSGYIREHRGTQYPDLSKWKWRWFMLNAKLDLPFRNPLENKPAKMKHCTYLVGDCTNFCGLTMFPNTAELEPDDMREHAEIEQYTVQGVNVLEEFTIKE
jgi:hypothetical protein